MSRYHIEIGGSPVDEECTQIGPDQHPDQLRYNRLECRAYIAALRAHYGQEPPGCAFRLQSMRHDFGIYYAVVIDYDSAEESCLAYAQRCEDGVRTWHEVGMWPPITWTGGQPRHVLERPELWFYKDNPDCRLSLPAPGPTTDRSP